MNEVSNLQASQNTTLIESLILSPLLDPPPQKKLGML